MQVRMSAGMVDALKATPEIPDNLMRCVTTAKRDGSEFLVTLSEDETMAMQEMCQWYIQKDPATGNLTARAQIFDAIVRVIYQAEDA